AQGVGQALMEQVVYDRESGQLLTATFMDYAIPRADTLPDMHIESDPVPTKLNPLGAKGAGEAGPVGAPPGVVHAVIDALAPLRSARTRQPSAPAATAPTHSLPHPPPRLPHLPPRPPAPAAPRTPREPTNATPPPPVLGRVDRGRREGAGMGRSPLSNPFSN